MATTPDLNELYHNVRTLPAGQYGGSGVGYDMKIENFNLTIKTHVDMHVSDPQLVNFFQDWASIESVQEAMRARMYSNREARHWRGRDARADIETLKSHFRDRIGSTWAQATRPNQSVKMVDGAERQTKPWVKNCRGDGPAWF